MEIELKGYSKKWIPEEGWSYNTMGNQTGINGETVNKSLQTFTEENVLLNFFALRILGHFKIILILMPKINWSCRHSEMGTVNWYKHDTKQFGNNNTQK